MGISKEKTGSLAILKQGIEELSSMNTYDEALGHALKLSLTLIGASTGFIMLRTQDDRWVIHKWTPSDESTIPLRDTKDDEIPLTLFSLRSMQAMPLSPDGRGKGEGGFSGELSAFILDRFNIKINRVVPIKVEETLKALLLLGDKMEGGIDDFQAACLSIIAQHLSILLSNIELMEKIREMSEHYEDIIVKKETAEKLASLGTIAAGLAHEIKNPLVSIKTLAQLLPERFNDPEFRDYFTNIAINEVDRIGSIVSDLLDFAKSSEPKFEPLYLEKFIDNILTMLSSQFAQNGITIRKRYSTDIPLINADHSQIKQALLNLLINSMEAMPQGGEIMIEVGVDKDIACGDRVYIRIRDNGSGIREEDKPHLFEPFFTTKGSGTGLGLSICRRILEKHKGEISIDSAHNRGTTVTLMFPSTSPSPLRGGGRGEG